MIPTEAVSSLLIMELAHLLLLSRLPFGSLRFAYRFAPFGLDSANAASNSSFQGCGLSGWLETASAWFSAGEEVSIMRTYKVRVLVPAVYLIEAEDDEDVLKRVAEVYKRFYTKDFRDWIEPFVQPEDVQ